MIYKLQRSLVTNYSKARMLMYNKDRSAMGEGFLAKDIDELFGEKDKIFVEGDIDDDGVIHINKPVEDQGW